MVAVNSAPSPMKLRQHRHNITVISASQPFIVYLWSSQCFRSEILRRLLHGSREFQIGGSGTILFLLRSSFSCCSSVILTQCCWDANEVSTIAYASMKIQMRLEIINELMKIFVALISIEGWRRWWYWSVLWYEADVAMLLNVVVTNFCWRRILKREFFWKLHSWRWRNKEVLEIEFKMNKVDV